MHNPQPFKEHLEMLKTEITQRIHAIDHDIRHEGLTADWKEQAIERENDEVLESLGVASERELQMINEALSRIERGEYFYCSECGEEIPEARLELLPYTTLCVSCAEMFERR